MSHLVLSKLSDLKWFEIQFSGIIHADRNVRTTYDLSRKQPVRYFTKSTRMRVSELTKGSPEGQADRERKKGLSIYLGLLRFKEACAEKS